MSDSNVDVNDLDDFSDAFFGNKPIEVKNENEEITETPSATEEAEEADTEVEESAPEEEIEEDAPATEDDPEAEEEEKPASKAKGKKSVQERINELTRAAREAERRADALARDLEAIRIQPKEASPARQEPETASIEDIPNPDALLADGRLKYPLGEFDPAFIRDLTRFTIKQETEVAKKELETERQNQDAARAENELLTSWEAKLTTTAERIPDFREKIADLEPLFANLEENYGKYLASTIMSMEYGPDVLNYLANHPAEARQIASSGATRATIALGRIEARFESDVERENSVVTTQAPPPPPRTRGSGGKAGVSADTDDLEAFEKQFFVRRR